MDFGALQQRFRGAGAPKQYPLAANLGVSLEAMPLGAGGLWL
jgi:hypothetical protein